MTNIHEIQGRLEVLQGRASMLDQDIAVNAVLVEVEKVKVLERIAQALELMVPDEAHRLVRK